MRTISNDLKRGYFWRRKKNRCILDLWILWLLAARYDRCFCTWLCCERIEQWTLLIAFAFREGKKEEKKSLIKSVCRTYKKKKKCTAKKMVVIKSERRRAVISFPKEVKFRMIMKPKKKRLNQQLMLGWPLSSPHFCESTIKEFGTSYFWSTNGF